MRRVGILFNANIAAAPGLAQGLAEKLQQLGVSAWLYPAADEVRATKELAGTEMILSLGGDGSMLRAARLAAPEAIPILGINLGNLGFTTEINGLEALTRISSFLAGESWTDQRAMLQAELPSQSSPSVIHALNDVVVGRGSIVRVIRVKASVDGQPVTTYKGDGVIVATATGSTGYSLAAGGPILFPKAEEILLTPIAPHLSLSASLVLSPQSVVELEVQTAHEARVSIDGQLQFPLRSGDTVRIRRSPYTTRLLRIQPRSFFHQTLLQRLSAKGGSTDES
ncbi:NAD(+)/NADH kinase [Dehalococcoidia bacterium]|nr:NAD(+)/NADH kinase [Dehalococcoidia bacterium]